MISAVDLEDVCWPGFGCAHALDRIEMHYDDINDRLVLSGMAQRGWDNKKPISFPVWISDNRGLSWRHAGDLATNVGTSSEWRPSNPAVHTSSTDRWLYFFSCPGGTPTLMFSADELVSPPARWALHTSRYQRCAFLGQGNETRDGHEIQRNTVPGALTQKLATPSVVLSRAATRSHPKDIVWIGCPAIETVTGPGGDLVVGDRQVAHVFQIQVSRAAGITGTIGKLGGPEAVKVLEHFKIEPERHEESIVFPTLIAPDKAGGVPWNDGRRGTVLLSWLETGHLGGHVVFHQQSRALSGNWQSHRTELTMSGGSAAPWTSVGMTCGMTAHIGGDGKPKMSCWDGDYQYGAFLQSHGSDKLEFLRVWGESVPHVGLKSYITTHANLVEVTGP